MSDGIKQENPGKPARGYVVVKRPPGEKIREKEMPGET
jgi:hypothetical protein